MRHWDCLVCATPQETIDSPWVPVCDTCKGTRAQAARLEMGEFMHALEAAYNRGFNAGRKVAGG